MMPFLDRIGISLLVVYLLLSCSHCAANTTDTSSGASSTTKQTEFPTVAVGKDSTSLYYVNMTFGTPAQRQALRIDIAQPYLWLLSDDVLSDCNASVSACNTTTRYASNNSKTSIDLNDGYVYNFDFLDTIDVNGSAVMDNMNFTCLNMNGPEVSVESEKDSPYDVEFTSNYLSIANVSFIDSIFASYLNKGSLGLSAKISNSTTDLNSQNFDNSFFFLDLLTSMGIIESSSYSLWLGADDLDYSSLDIPANVNANCGKLILGAVDPNLFYGQLTKFEMIPAYDVDTGKSTTSYPILPMGPMYIVSNTGKSLNMTAEEFSQPVLLDSRYGTSYLPLDAIVQIALQIGANYVESLGKWLVPCSVADLGVHINFTFADNIIQVPLSDFLASTYDSASNTTMHFPGGATACSLAIVSRARTGFNVLGGSFLKNVYMAVDLEDRSLAIAQARKAVSLSYSHSSSVSSTPLSPSANATSLIKAITSGYIPYAITANVGSNLTFSQDQMASAVTDIPDQLTATIYSDGMVSTGRSFYDTSRVNTSPTSSAASAESFIFTNSSSNVAKKNRAPQLSAVMLKDGKSFSIWSFVLPLVGILLTGFLL